jgi:diguanylate cyclase (GGDEF)-like protein
MLRSASSARCNPASSRGAGNGRVAGDEFAVVAPNTGSDAARRSAERLIHRLSEQSNDHGQRATVSVGIATFDSNRSIHTDVDSLVRAADEALYLAKATGRNRVQAA